MLNQRLGWASVWVCEIFHPCNSILWLALIRLMDAEDEELLHWPNHSIGIGLGLVVHHTHGVSSSSERGPKLRLVVTNDFAAILSWCIRPYQEQPLPRKVFWVGSGLWECHLMEVPHQSIAV